MYDVLVLVFAPNTLLSIVMGIVFGLVVGAIPGLTATMAVALLLPITFGMNGVTAIVMLGSLYAAATYGGSIAAILFNTPGTPSSAATCLDGYTMTQKGEAGKALIGSTLASVFGGVVGVLALLLIAPPLSRLSLMFGPMEFFLLALFGLSVIGGLSSGNLIKGIIAGMLGLFFGLVGMDPMSAVPRFTLGNMHLESGIPLIPALIGMFSVTQVMFLVESASGQNADSRVMPKETRLSFSFREFIPLLPTMSYCSVIGTIIGILPGAGGDVATWVGYNEAKRISKHPEKFGTGCLDGIVASESANNAVVGSAMIPLLTLGIPGSNVTAVMLGALLIHGLQPGRTLFTTQATYVYAIIFGLLLAQLLFGVIGLLFIPFLKKFAKIPYQILGAAIIIFAIIGSYAINNSIPAVWIMVFFGLLGYFMRRYDFPVAATILGLILCTMAENGLRQSWIISNGEIVAFFATRPIAMVIFAITLFSLSWTLLPSIRKNLAKFTDD